MAVGITSTGELMVRVGADGEGEALADPDARPFDMTGRSMKGWILVERAHLETEAERTHGCAPGRRVRTRLAREALMAVDVVTEIEIAQPRPDGCVRVRPRHATRWYANIQSVEWQTPPPLAVGSRLEFVARFMGRRPLA